MTEHEVLIDAEALQAKVLELAAEVNRDYADREVLLVCVLKGAVVFMTDLMRCLDVPYEIDFMAVQSYEGTKSTGVVKIVKDLDRDLTGRHVLLVEDIVDSGLTLQFLLGHLRAQAPASLEVCALLTKPAKRKVEIEARYTGFEIPDRFVVGYGLDVDEKLRGLPHIAVLDAA
jgi:hypoxanthine phosphoribosyltransferase